MSAGRGESTNFYEMTCGANPRCASGEVRQTHAVWFVSPAHHRTVVVVVVLLKVGKSCVFCELDGSRHGAEESFSELAACDCRVFQGLSVVVNLEIFRIVPFSLPFVSVAFAPVLF